MEKQLHIQHGEILIVQTCLLTNMALSFTRPVIGTRQHNASPNTPPVPRAIANTDSQDIAVIGHK